jgi:hypothetical protein
MFVADRNERRNITEGQKAMAYAFLFPNGEKGGRGKKDPAKTSKSVGGFSDELLRQARAVLRYSPTLVEKVGLDYTTVRTYAAVACAYELSSRNDNVSFTHHRLAIGAPGEARQAWLKRAEIGSRPRGN